MHDAPPGPTALHDADGALALYFDDGTVQSRILPAEPTRLVLEYTRLMMGFLLFQPSPARIAMIGLGGGSLLRYCAATLPDAEFTAVEISPAVIALRDAFGVPPDGPRLRVLCEDGAAFVRRDGAPLDVLLVDGFDRTGQPEPLCTTAFYDACRARLGDAGVLVVNLHADDLEADGRTERIRRAFGDGLVVPVHADGSDNTVVFAGTSPPFPPPFRELVARLRMLAPRHPVDLERTARKILDRATRPAWRGRRGRRR